VSAVGPVRRLTGVRLQHQLAAFHQQLYDKCHLSDGVPDSGLVQNEVNRREGFTRGLDAKKRMISLWPAAAANDHSTSFASLTWKGELQCSPSEIHVSAASRVPRRRCQGQSPSQPARSEA
jgi:hypothetical protein